MLSGNSDFENNLLIEHASDATVFKEFRCGIKKMDDFIHEGTPWAPRAGPIGGAGLALPAGTWRRTMPVTFLAM